MNREQLLEKMKVSGWTRCEDDVTRRRIAQLEEHGVIVEVDRTHSRLGDTDFYSINVALGNHYNTEVYDDLSEVHNALFLMVVAVKAAKESTNE